MSGAFLHSKLFHRKGMDKSASDPSSTADERLKPNELAIQKQPTCMISSKDGALYIEQVVLEQLKSIPGKIVVVAIAGVYRTGKSYLMNRLAGRSTGFALGAEIDSVTKGIWIWVRPHPVWHNVNLVLMDTEGLADPDKGDPEHDNWIFILATVLSSVLVYNVMGVINEDMITKINYISEMSKRIKVLQKEEEDEEEVIQGYFPIFIMAVRDFSLSLIRQGKKITSDEYFEGLLKSKSSEEYNAPRECIKKYFHHRKCFTFDRPATKKKLEMLEELSDDELSEDFLDDTKGFTTFIYNECQPKTTLNDTPMTCYTLALLVTNFVKSIRAGEIPCVKSTLHFVIKEANQKAIESAVIIYQDVMDNVDLPTEDENATLFIANSKAVGLAVKTFQDNKFEDATGAFQAEFMDRTGTLLSKYMEKNKNESIKACEEALKKLGSSIKENLLLCVYMKSGGFDEYKKDIELLRKKFMQTKGLGYMRSKSWLKYMDEKRSEFQQVQTTDRRMTQMEKSYEELLRAKELDRQKADPELEKIKQTHEEMKASFEKLILDLQREYRKDVEKMFTEDRKHREQQDLKLKEAMDKLNKKFEHESAEREREFQTQLHDLDCERAEIEKEKKRLNEQKKGLHGSKQSKRGHLAFHV